jgi:hypothetical protein
MTHSSPVMYSRWCLLAVSALAFACRSDKVIGIRHEPPAVQIVEPSNDSTHDAFASVQFVAQVDTYDGSDLTDIEHHWVSGSDVRCDWDTVPSDGLASCFMSFDEPGVHSITVTVKNTRLDTATATISVNVTENHDPTILIVAPDGGSYFASEDAITLEAVLDDAEDSPELLTLVGTSSLDGDLGLSTAPSSSGDWAGNISGLSAGEHLITLTVYDLTGLSGQDTVSFTINESPGTPVISITPDPAASGTQLTANIDVEAVDPEGDPISYEYQWFVGGTAFPGGTTPVVSAGVTQRDEYWEVLVTARDPHSAGDPGTASITIGNSPPRVDAVSISPFAPQTNDDLTSVATGWFDQDSDVESYTYEWEQNGLIDIEETLSTFPSEKTVRGDEIRVHLTPEDAFSAGDAVASTIVTIENSPPTGGNAIITPEDPEPTDGLLCTVDVASSDADGDAISYSFVWLRDGTEMPGLTTAFVTSSELADGETWTCEVTPSDDVEDGASFSVSIGVTDGSAPPPPLIDTPAAHRNKDFMDLSGTCESACVLDFYCSDAITSWSIEDACTEGGTFSVTIDPLTRGEVTSCYATCTDAADNTSGDSITVSSEVCDPEDIYENGSYGDAMEDPIDEWSILLDDGTTTVNIIGNILEDDDDDWYIISAGDNLASDLAAGRDDFKFDAKVSLGDGLYSFIVYRDDPLGADADSCMPDADGYTEYSWFYETRDDGTFRGLPADLQSCDAGSISQNTCEDHSSDFYLQVFRNASIPATCENYQLQITNGVW